MDVTASLEARVDADELMAVVGDLGTYPEWLEIVPRAVAEESPDGAGAWSVDLRAQLGPFRRSKRLRMVRRRGTPADTVVFHRRELDGRDHSDWTLTASIRRGAAGDPVVLTMHLHYGGSMWVPLLDRLLADEIERSRSRLVELVRAPG